LALTVDIKAKVMRSKSLLEVLADGDPRRMRIDPQMQQQMKRQWIGETVIAMYDKKFYHVTDLIFDQSPASMPVGGLGMSHADYFKQRKGIDLTYPDVKVMVAVEGRRKSTIYVPPELVCGTDLDIHLKRELPMLTSFTPKVRSSSIDEIRRYLIPGAQKTKGAGGGLLPALGIILKDDRLAVKAETLLMPQIMAAGIQIPSHKGQNWGPTLASANFKVNPNEVTNLNVVVIVHQSVEGQTRTMYGRVRQMVNRCNASFRFPEEPYEIVAAGDLERHWGAVERFFGGTRLPDNVFVIDFNKPPRRAATDPAYSVIKQMLGKAGHLSQFINLNTYDHSAPRDMRKSDMILQGVSRQILSKCGFRVWWVSIPRSVPLPVVFVGVDVFHAPRKYDPVTKTRIARASCAAIIVQVVRQSSGSSNKVEIYSETFKREASMEYDLGDAMYSTVSNALKHLNVSPASCIVWRDGVGEGAVTPTAAQEIPSVRRALAQASPGKNPALAYIVAQKRIATKFVTKDGEHSAPPGTLVMGVQGLDHSTFYINGTSPSFATAKPVRFIVASQDNGLDTKMLAELSWALCHDYPNWAGPVKVPGPVQLAHKAAEVRNFFCFAGNSIRCG
jgi:aubergine-like protein